MAETSYKFHISRKKMLMSSEICADFVGNFMSSMFTVPGKKREPTLDE